MSMPSAQAREPQARPRRVLTLFLSRETAITQKRPYHASRQM